MSERTPVISLGAGVQSAALLGEGAQGRSAATTPGTVAGTTRMFMIPNLFEERGPQSVLEYLSADNEDAHGRLPHEVAGISIEEFLAGANARAEGRAAAAGARRSRARKRAPRVTQAPPPDPRPPREAVPVASAAVERDESKLVEPSSFSYPTPGLPEATVGRGRRTQLTEASFREAVAMWVEGCPVQTAASLLWHEDARGYKTPRVLAGALRLQLTHAFGADGATEQRARARAALARGGELLARPRSRPVAELNRRGLTDALLAEAAWLYYYEELGFDRLSRRLLGRTLYGNRGVLKSALREAFVRNGWPRRERDAASRAATRARARGVGVALGASIRNTAHIGRS